MQQSVQSQLTIAILWQFHFNPILSGVTIKIYIKMDYKTNLNIGIFGPFDPMPDQKTKQTIA